MGEESRILVVDDDAQLCANMQDILEANNYTVDTALNGKDAITLCQETKYDIALVDIRLTDIQGPELVDKIAKISPSTEFIYMTGYASLDSAIEAAKQERVASYETKPLDMDHLLSKIKQIARRRRAEEEKKKLEAQLQQARKMEAIGTLAGGIAHDFNNLLMAIQGNASLMLFDIDATHPHYGNVKKIEKQVRSCAELTRQLLGYARKGRYEVKPVSLNNLVEETSETFCRTRKEITIHRELAEDLFAIEADEGQIEQVMLNLYVNASDAMSICADCAEAMPGGGNLILKTMNVTHEDMGQNVYDVKPGKYVLLTVTDTGEGMDKETRERIFEPFFTTKEMGRGTGLGLASAYGIVKAHGGYIDVDSEKERGATFSVYLPATEKKVEKSVKAAGQIIIGSGTVLLVDDEEAVLEVGIKLLNKLGYTVLEAKSGREAVELYKENKDKIDVVLLDMVMPDMGGGEAYDRLKEIKPNVKVLLSSGYSIDSEAKEILKRGCDAFIQKPFGMEGLSQSIKKVLTRGTSIKL